MATPTEKKKRVPSEARKKASLVLAHGNALDKLDKAHTALAKVEERCRLADQVVAAAETACAAAGIRIETLTAEDAVAADQTTTGE